MWPVVRAGIKLLLGRGSVQSYSQFGEDVLINSFFRYKSKGFYVDVGCYHPHLYSNTYLLYKKGWSGIGLDANSDMALLWQVYRPRDKFICTGVGQGVKSYKRNVDGAYNGFIEGDGERLRPLSDFITRKVDVLNVDVEGMDLAVLKSHNWVIKPRVVCVEAEMGGATQQFLESKGYQLGGVCGLSLIFI